METNTTTFTPTDGPKRGQPFEQHVCMPYENVFHRKENGQVFIGHYTLDHATATATWVPSKFYDEVRHG